MVVKFTEVVRRDLPTVFLATIVTLHNCSNTSNLACVTLKRSARGMRSSAADTDPKMLFNNRMAHPNMCTVKEMIRISQYGMNQIYKQQFKAVQPVCSS